MAASNYFAPGCCGSAAPGTPIMDCSNPSQKITTPTLTLMWRYMTFASPYGTPVPECDNGLYFGGDAAPCSLYLNTAGTAWVSNWVPTPAGSTLSPPYSTVDGYVRFTLQCAFGHYQLFREIGVGPMGPADPTAGTNIPSHIVPVPGVTQTKDPVFLPFTGHGYQCDYLFYDGVVTS